MTARTTDGGGSWTEAALRGVSPDGGVTTYLPDLVDVSCPTLLFCLAVGYWDGSEAAAHTHSGPPNGGVVKVSNDGGVTWSDSLAMPVEPNGPGAFYGVTCQSALHCIAVGTGNTLGSSPDDIITTTDGGASWTPQSSLSPPYQTFADVACGPSTTCIAVGYNGLYAISSDDGVTWTTKSFPGAFDANDISCPTDLDCYEAGSTFSGGGEAAASTDGGNTWTVQVLPANWGGLSSISCSSGSTCVATASALGSGVPRAAIDTTSNGGLTWIALPVPSGVSSLSGVSCPTSTACTAVGTDVEQRMAAIASTDGGSTWASEALPTTMDTLDSVSCPAGSTTCVAVDTLGHTVGSTDGGTTWAQQANPPINPPSSNSLAFYPGSAISCATTSSCVAIALGRIEATTDGGASWVAQTKPLDSGATFALACPATTVCFGAGSGIIATTDGGTTWADQTLPSGVNGFNAIACPTVRVCFAVGQTQPVAPLPGHPVIAVTSDGGVTWTSQSVPAGVDGFQSISCPTPTSCMALGWHSNSVTNQEDSVLFVTTDSGTMWTPQPLPSNFGVASSALSCVTVSMCVLGGVFTNTPNFLAGFATTSIGGSHWTIETAPGVLTTPQSISCASTSLCVAVGPNYVSGSMRLVRFGNGGVVVTGSPGASGPAIATDALPNGAVAIAYDQTLVAEGGTPPYNWSVVSGTLPNGLTLNPATGEITGIPTALGTQEVTFEITDGNGQMATVTLPVTITIDPTSVTASTIPTSTQRGRSVTFSAKVDSLVGTPTGTVSFTSGATILCATPMLVNGQGSCASTNAPVGLDTIVAHYSGDADHLASTSTTTLTVLAPPPPKHGYWLVGGDGGIFSFGSAHFYGSTGNMVLQRPVVGIATTADRKGYWLVAGDGGIFAFGDAGFHGSIPGLGIASAGTPGAVRKLAAPIVGIVPSTDGNGYLMVASDGGVFAFGDAQFAGSCPGVGGCSGAGVAVVPDATGHGYWLVTQTGNVYPFGDAPHYGSPVPQGTVTSAVRTPDGKGYWVLFSDGAVTGFGDATNFGSLVAGIAGHDNPASAIFGTSEGHGYWVATGNGAVLPFGDAPSDGSMYGNRLNAPIIAGVGW